MSLNVKRSQSKYVYVALESTNCALVLSHTTTAFKENVNKVSYNINIISNLPLTTILLDMCIKIVYTTLLINYTNRLI